MRIGLNLLYLIPGVVGGTETYAISLLRAIARVDSKNEYLAFVPREAAKLDLPTVPNFTRVVCNLRASRRPARYAWEQAVLPLQLRSRRVDLLHSLAYVGPLIAGCPHVVTIHDVNFAALRDSMPASRRRWLRLVVGGVARTARHVIAVSEFSRSEILRHLGAAPERVSVVHEAVETAALADEPSWGILAAAHRVRKPYVLAFSSPSAHKNVPRLIESFAAAGASLPHLLVLVGHLPPDASIRAAIHRLGLGNRVVVTGYVPSAHVRPLLRHADLFVSPSLYEGFGLSVLEAQAERVAVACSRVGSLPEVAGEGAVYFDPRSADDMGAVVRRALLDAGLREKLVCQGLENLTRFSWDEAARRTVAIYESQAPY